MVHRAAKSRHNVRDRVGVLQRLAVRDAFAVAL
jgi:hypothetical protein